MAEKRWEMRYRGVGEEVTCTDLQRVISHWKRPFMEEFQILTAPIMAFALQQISHMHILFMWFLFCSKNEKQKISTLSAIDELWQMSYSTLIGHEYKQVMKMNM
jgi:TFIIF-interacting CTD phosphatase-like protein